MTVTGSDNHGSARGTSNPALVSTIRSEIERNGPISLARFMELALYEPDLGYYRRQRRSPGRGGDFLTAPETHPFFGFTLARQVVEFWERLERPARFTVREYGPGVGGLAYDILAALHTHAPDLFATIDYRLVDLNAYRMEEARAAFVEAGLGEIVSIEAPEAARERPIVGVALANEVVDALPAHQLVVDGDEFRERFVTWDEAAAWFGTTLGPLSAEVGDSRVVNALGSQGVVPGALPDGAILEVSPRAAGWIREVAQGIERGYALIVDYGYPAAELYRGHRLGGLLRGYREHTVTDDPFTAIGEQDLTTHVDFSWLASAARGAGMHEIGLTTQADFLAALGLGDMLVTFQHDGETSIDEYYQAQAAVLRLIDPGGMGRFRVLGLSKGVTNADGVHPVRGFVAPALDYPEF